jgi:Mn2+/Fe2+ NRAMP family transporter
VATADIAGVAASLQLFHIPTWVSVPLVSIGLLLLMIRGSYIMVEKGLLILTALFLAYPIAAFTVHPDWAEAFRTMLVPTVQWLGIGHANYLPLAIGLIGTTIAPWMTFYLQASIVDKGVRRQDLPLQRFDVIFGAISANVIAFFIIVTSARLWPQFSTHNFANAGEAAEALRSLVHGAAPYLFGAGLFAASVLGTAAVPLTTAYAVTEAFGWERGLDNKLSQAPVFFGLLIGTIGLGAIVVMLTPVHLLMPLILFSQVINGMLVPIILVFMVILCNRARLMGAYTNSRTFNAIAWGTIILVTAMTIAYFVVTLLK